MFEAGIDVGLKEFATFSDGTVVHNPKHFYRLEEKSSRGKIINYFRPSHTTVRTVPYTAVQLR